MSYFQKISSYQKLLIRKFLDSKNYFALIEPQIEIQKKIVAGITQIQSPACFSIEFSSRTPKLSNLHLSRTERIKVDHNLNSSD